MSCQPHGERSSLPATAVRQGSVPVIGSPVATTAGLGMANQIEAHDSWVARMWRALNCRTIMINITEAAAAASVDSTSVT